MLHMLLNSFLGKYCIYMECQRLSSRTATSSSLAILEDPMRQARNQATLLHGIPSSNRRPNGGDKPHTLRSTSSTHQEEHQGVGGVSTNHQFRIQLSKTLNNRQVPLRGRLRIQHIVTIGHSSSTTPRAHQFGRKCACYTSQEDA